MSKKIWLFSALGVLVAVVIGVVVYFVISGKKSENLAENNSVSSIISDSDLTKQLPKQVVGELIYKDPAGYSFKYPRGIEIADETPDDNVYYTLLTLSKDNQVLTVSAFDSQETSIESWIKNSARYKSASLAGAVSLGGMSAKQYSSDSSLITIALDQGVIYLIEGLKDNGYWEETHNVLINTFAFDQKSPVSGSSNVIYEPEELVQ